MMAEGETNYGWIIASVGSISTVLGIVLGFILKWNSQQSQQKHVEGEDVYNRQSELMDRMQIQVDAVQQEMSRRLVVESAAREENAKLRTQNTYFYAIIEQLHSQAIIAKLPVPPLPERPVYGTPEAIQAELEFMNRTRQADTDMINIEVASVK